MLGANCIVLHGHLPYVHHPLEPDFLEEDWFFEACVETYLPLLFVLDDLAKDDVPVRLTIGLTPPLLEMLRAPALGRKLKRHLQRRRELAEGEVRRLRNDPRVQPAARHYAGRAHQLIQLHEALGGDLVAGFRRHQDEGRIEILASTATHAILPLLLTPAAQRAQIAVGLDLYREVFGRDAQGFWLPECASSPDVEPMLVDRGVRYAILEGHALADTRPASRYGTARPSRLASGLTVFLRDPESSREVWSSKVGYPGDPHYREYYRDLGFDGDYDAIRPFLHDDGVRRNLGIKYHRVTGEVLLHEKLPWEPALARARARVHADDYLTKRAAQLARLAREHLVTPALLSPYDMELFGHWWYEGPWFLDALFRRAAAQKDRPLVRLATPSQVLAEGGPCPEGVAAPSTWGRHGYFEVWLNSENSWMWAHLHELESRLGEHVDEAREPDARSTRLLDQMARELLLAQSSDWPFIVTHETAAHYATKRLTDHVHRFLALERSLQSGDPLPADLEHRIFAEDILFPGLDHRVFAGGATHRGPRLGTPAEREEAPRT